MSSMWRRARALWVSAVVSVALLPYADGAVAAEAPREGTALPALSAPLPAGQVTSASPDYVLHDSFQPVSPYTERTYAVVRVSDGQTVRTFTAPRDRVSALEPRLVGSSLVQVVEPDGGRRLVEVREAATGTLQRTIDVSGHVLLHADTRWALVSDVGASTGENTLRIVRDSGEVTTVPGSFDSTPTWIGGDAGTAYLSDLHGDVAVDVATGTRTSLAFPEGARLYAVGPTHLIARAVTPGGGSTGFRTLTRAALQPGWSADVPTDHRNRAWLPYGTGIAELYLPDEAPSAHFQALRPVDVATGTLQAPVAVDVSGTQPLTDGRTALTVSGPPGGSVLLVGAGPARTLTQLPRHDEQAVALGLSGGRVVVGWSARSGLWSTSAPGTEPWATAYGDPGFPSGRKRLDLAGDVVLTSNIEVSRGPHHRLQWPGGSRDLVGTDAHLGHGGRFVELLDFRDGGTLEVSEVRTGTVVARYSGTRIRPIDGRWIWTQPDAAAVMRGTDLDGDDPERQAQLPAGCARGAVQDVRGRWALVSCGNDLVAVDLTGELAPHALPPGRRATALGRGFVVTVLEDSSSGSPRLDATVTDLATGDSRTYGPVHGGLNRGEAGIEADDGGSPELVYLDPASQVRRVVLDWLSTDARPPRLVSSPQLPEAVSSTKPVQVALAWSWSGATSYDVRRGDRSGSTRTLPAAWQRLAAPSVTASLTPGTGACFSSRARDRAGNLSGWSPAVCQYLDGAAPTMGPATGSVAHPSTLRTPVRYAARATDDDRVVSYDLETRSAARGRGLGAWTRVVDHGPAASLVTAAQAPGSATCVRSRARDAAGNQSSWTPARCTTAPVDDRDLARSGGTRAYPSAAAVGGGFLRLWGQGASATLASQTGSTVGVWVIRGPGLGSADVYAGGRSIGRIGFGAATTRRALVLLPVGRTFTGGVRIVNRGSTSVRVDAITVAR